MSLDTKEISYDYNGASVLSIPILKYIPHGKFRKATLDSHARYLQNKLEVIEFTPDAIIGHFCNPTIELVERIRLKYKDAKTAVIFHEGADTINRILGVKAESRINDIDVLGFRSLSIQRSIEGAYRLSNHRFLC